MRLSRLFVPAIVAMAVVAPLHGHVSAQSATSDATKLFQRAVTAYQAANTLRVEFEQTLVSALTGAKSTSRGEMIRKQPNLFTINFSDPASDRIVNDGKSIWLYLPSTAPGQVIKISVKKTGGMLVDPLGQILSSTKDRYTLKSAGQATLNGQATRAVTLTPIEPAEQNAMFTSATVWIGEKDGRVYQIETKESSGLQRKIVITKYTEGTSIPAAMFQFKVPPKVRVVDQDALMGGKR